MPFVPIPWSDLSASRKATMEANGAGMPVPMSGEAYYNMRGGVDSTGIYGDSYVEGSSLTPAEYQAAKDAAMAIGGTGVSLGDAINKAKALKEYQYNIATGMDPALAQSIYNQDLAGTAGMLQYNNYTGPTVNPGLPAFQTPKPITPVAPALPVYSPPVYIPPVAPVLPPINPVPPKPVTPPPPPPPPPPPVKSAPIDTILFDPEDSLPIEIMADLLFEDIGGQELLNISRNDTINGQTIIYQPIKNLTQIQQQYNPNNILKLQDTSNTYFENFSIKFDQKVPNVGNGPEGSNVYIDPLTGDLIIEVVNTFADEQVEIEIIRSGTIYEAEI